MCGSIGERGRLDNSEGVGKVNDEVFNRVADWRGGTGIYAR